MASTPVIRGLSGPRVLIAQNGLDVSDVSRVGPDHSVATEASTAEQIEVLRGPATLFYGSGAIGGVVNVVDGRVPTDSTTRGEWLLETNSVNTQKSAAFNVTTGGDAFAVYADGYWRKSDDYETPVAAEQGNTDEHKASQFVVENSREKSHGYTLGGSYLFNQGYLGLAVEQFERQYGIPGHTHRSHEESEADEANVFADLAQTRVQLLGEFNLKGKWISSIKLRGGYSDYEHAEIENNTAGTIFNNETQELKVDLLHNPLMSWNGGLSFHFKQSDVAAQGEEAFTPPSKMQTLAFALMEEKHIGDVLLQLGARVEQVTLKANDVLLPHLEAHAHHDAEENHDEEHDHNDHADEDDSAITRVFAADYEFTPISFSGGLVWDFTPGYNIGLSVSRSQRAPSASELLAFGPHIGTRTYEVGALFAVHNDDDHTHIGLSEQVIDLETANNLDFTVRKTQGDIGFVFNAFYNQVDNYYYQISTGLFAESGHDHNHDHGHAEDDLDEHDHNEAVAEDEHTDELPVYLFQTADVILHGFEAQLAWQVSHEFKATVFSDYVRARLQNGGELPRTPPLRFGTQFSYQATHLSAHLDITRYQEQDRIAAYETSTQGYTLVDASVSYDLSVLNHDIALYLKGHNLTNTEARVHTSFTKDIAPRPGRSIAVGIKGYF